MRKLLRAFVFALLAGIQIGNAADQAPSRFNGGTVSSDISIGDASSLGRDIFLLPSFKNADMKLYMLASGDGINWSQIGTALYTPATGNLRDPSIFYYNQIYYIAHTTSASTAASFSIIASSDLVNWTKQAEVSCLGAGTVDRTYSPEFFQDSDGSVHIFVSLSTNTGSNYRLYELSAQNSALTSWSSPTLVPVGTTMNTIDPFVFKNGSVYYLYWKNETSKYIEYATSTALTSGYSVAGSGDFASWGNTLEGPSVVQLASGRFRIYMDAYTENGIYYAESADLSSWGSKALTSMPFNFPHGTILRTSSLSIARNILGLFLSKGGVWTRTSAGIGYLGKVGSGTESPGYQADIQGTSSGSTLALLNLRNNANADNTGVKIRVVPETADTALAEEVFVRTSQSTGVMTYTVNKWDGSALQAHWVIDQDGAFKPWSRTAVQLRALVPRATGSYLHNSTDGKLYVSTGTSAGQWAQVGNYTVGP